MVGPKYGIETAGPKTVGRNGGTQWWDRNVMQPLNMNYGYISKSVISYYSVMSIRILILIP